MNLDRNDWISEVKSHGVLTVARSIGLEEKQKRSLAPCPNCGASQRGRNAKNLGPIGVRIDDQGWHCHLCAARGDALRLILLAKFGDNSRKREDYSALYTWCFEAGFCGPSNGKNQIRREIVKPIEAIPLEPPKRPPKNEVSEVWEISLPIDEDKAASTWLKEIRKFSTLQLGFLVDRDLVRAIPENLILPAWCRFKGRPWNETGHRLIVKMFGPTGELESLHARNINEHPLPGEKAAAPTGSECSGLIMADPFGVLLLQTGSKPLWWKEGPLKIAIAEGEPDFLTWATKSWDHDLHSPAVFGVVSGSWTQALAERIPPGSKVVIRTHLDAAGERYAEKIHSTLSQSCEVLRPKNTTKIGMNENED